ncbi:hypothetical protein FDP41_012139 [Naegleria fowleri]|uniref:Trichohyalin-plectin-homology domain-containing protein n=1 Tax=Naegleria fowleri TaxID=5763 RepID=A0A6A5C405_NAEFO|nr:uncharacterized protein FDP41_012139 [Naegleria fowleri]KAF0981482.1 hypothetical protein FDP41_012139 [Naegleria fowleri]
MTQTTEEFSIASERWQVLEKERLEIRRQRELIEHRIDLRYHSEAGLEHHKSDYMKRLLKKVEENFEKSKIRNRKLLARAEQALNDANMAQSTHLVSSKVKLEVAKKQFLQNFQLRLHEFEALSRQEKLRQIRKAEEEIELQKQKSRTSQLEWEREKKLNNDLQEKVKELIITKEQAKKDAIEREAERKSILYGERNIQKMSEQASLEASKRFMEKQEKKKKMEATDGKEIKNVIDDVYEGKIANAREKFVTAAIIPNRSDDLYYNDGYSSMEENKL